MNRPLLSVVVPTKDRAEYAYWCIRSLQAMLSPVCEIVIQDNSRTDELRSRLAAEDGGLEKVRYAWAGGPLSITDNCDRAIDAAQGEYVTLIGDDDTIGPDLEAVVRWAAEHKIDAVVPANLAHFYWPDLHGGDSSSAKGRMVLKPFSGRTQPRDVVAGRDAFLRDGGLSIVDSTSLPKLYYGLVRRDCMAEVKTACGTYFPGISPDVAIAVALSTVVRSLYSVDYPLYLPGSSYKSGAGSSARKQHYGRLEDQKHLSRAYIADWPDCVPKIYTVQTLWAGSVAQALRALRRDDLLQKLNLERMNAFCYLFNPTLRAAVREATRRQESASSQGKLTRRLAFWYHYVEGVGLRVRMLLARWLRRKSVVGEIKLDGPVEIAAAARVFQETLDRYPHRLELGEPSSR